MIEIRPCGTQEIIGAVSLIEEYADECAIPGMPRPQPQREMYSVLETNGSLQPFGAYRGDELVGFIVVLLVRFPHYGAQSASTESFFVSKPYRKTGAGIRLLRTAERFAKLRGATGLLVSAPANGTLERLMPRLDGYNHSNTVFFKKL